MLASDEADLLRFLMGSNQYEFQFESDRRLDENYPAEFLKERIGLGKARQGRFFVAENPDGGLCGWVACYVGHHEIFVKESERPYGYIAELYVDEEFRGRHIGRKLMATCERYFRSLNIGSVMISALASNDRAVKSYRAAGFRDYSINFRKIL